LGLEEVCYHGKYKGTREKRGLFSSSIKKLLNADLNGAINIMRKYLLKVKKKLKRVIGLKLYNPVKVNIFCKVFN
jgi:transposase